MAEKPKSDKPMSGNVKPPAIFLDRDGIVNYRPVGDYIRKAEEFHIIPDFPGFFSLVKANGFLAILITNQQCLGKGLVTSSELERIHQFMQKEIKISTGCEFDDIFVCPDLDGTASRCRKPEPGMILDAIERWNIDPSLSWMIGDGPGDAVAGRRAGVRTVLVGSYKPEDCPEADFIARDLAEAAGIVFG